MDNTRFEQIVNEMDYMFNEFGSSIRQRDAFYIGYLLGKEITSKQNQKIPETNLLGDVATIDSIRLQKKLNHFFTIEGFNVKEKTHFRKGIELGLVWFT